MILIKNIILGIDGGSFQQISPLIHKGKLPNLSKMMAKGFFSALQVTIPPVTVPSWPCIFTGLTMEDLGKCSFYHPSYGIFSSEYWKTESIFSVGELRHFCLNVPSTYPAWQINGEMISGMLTPEISDKMVYPKSLFSKVRDNWIIDGENIQETFKAFDIKSEIFKSKLAEDFQLYTYVIRLPDCITHHPYISINSTKQYIEDAYIKIDKFIGELMDRSDIDNIFIISDHGLKIYNNELNIRRYFEKERLKCSNNELISKLMSVLMKVFGFINPRFFDTTFFHNKFKYLLSKFIKINGKSKTSALDSLKLIHFYSNYGGIYIPKRYKALKDHLYNLLIHNKNIEKIYLYNSPDLPDIILKLKDKYLFSVKSSFFLHNYSNSFNHSDQGIFMAFGKHIKKGHSSSLSYIDILPTILTLYGINKPSYMKGKALGFLK